MRLRTLHHLHWLGRPMEGLDLSLPLRGVGQVTISQTEPQFWEWCPVPEVAICVNIYIYIYILEFRPAKAGPPMKTYYRRIL